MFITELQFYNKLDPGATNKKKLRYESRKIKSSKSGSNSQD